MKKSVFQIRAAEHARNTGNLTRAVALCGKILRRQPGHADALHLAGIALAEAGHDEHGIVCIAAAFCSADPALTTAPTSGGCFCAAGVCRRPRLVSARRCERRRSTRLSHSNWDERWLRWVISMKRCSAFDQAACLDPGLAEAHYSRGVLHNLGGRFEQARACYEEALRLEPGHALAHNNLAILLHGAGDLDHAESHYRASVQAAPGRIDTLYNLGRVQEDSGNLEPAAEIFEGILEHHPDHAAARTELGELPPEIGHPDRAIAAYRRALSAEPGFSDAHWNLALALLETGNHLEGWQEYEWRLRQWPALTRDFKEPMWDGQQLDGRPTASCRAGARRYPSICEICHICQGSRRLRDPAGVSAGARQAS